MPNYGRPSGACRTCKQRHVKCDETRPSCHRCLRTDRICPGYVEGLDLVLRSQNAVAKANVNRRQKAVQRARDSSQISGRDTSAHGCGSASSFPSSPSSSLSYSSPASDLWSIAPYLVPCEDDYSTCFFVDTWVLYPHDSLSERGFIEFLPAMYADAMPNSPLRKCVAAIGTSVFEKFIKWTKDADTLKVRQKYLAALAATRQALDDPVESLTDETLMAVCLLGFFEACVDSYDAKISSPRHFNGAAALIEKRQMRSRTDLARKLLLGVRSNLVYRALWTESEINQTDDLWQDDDEIRHNPATLLDSLSVEVVNIVAALKKPRAHRESSSILLARAQQADKRLSMWPNILPPSWHPIRLNICDIPLGVLIGGVYQDHCDAYSDVYVCGIWNDWRLARLKMLPIIAILDPDEKKRAEATAVIQQMADDICASIPFCLGSRLSPTPVGSTDDEYPMRVPGMPTPESQQRTARAHGGWGLFIPMKEVMRIGRFLRPGQVAWMGTQLSRLAKVYDVKPDKEASKMVPGHQYCEMIKDEDKQDHGIGSSSKMGMMEIAMMP